MCACMLSLLRCIDRGCPFHHLCWTTAVHTEHQPAQSSHPCTLTYSKCIRTDRHMLCIIFSQIVAIFLLDKTTSCVIDYRCSGYNACFLNTVDNSLGNGCFKRYALQGWSRMYVPNREAPRHLMHWLHRKVTLQTPVVARHTFWLRIPCNVRSGVAASTAIRQATPGALLALELAVGVNMHVVAMQFGSNHRLFLENIHADFERCSTDVCIMLGDTCDRTLTTVRNAPQRPLTDKCTTSLLKCIGDVIYFNFALNSKAVG